MKKISNAVLELQDFESRGKIHQENYLRCLRNNLDLIMIRTGNNILSPFYYVQGGLSSKDYFLNIKEYIDAIKIVLDTIKQECHDEDLNNLCLMCHVKVLHLLINKIQLNYIRLIE